MSFLLQMIPSCLSITIYHSICLSIYLPTIYQSPITYLSSPIIYIHLLIIYSPHFPLSQRVLGYTQYTETPILTYLNLRNSKLTNRAVTQAGTPARPSTRKGSDGDLSGEARDPNTTGLGELHLFGRWDSMHVHFPKSQGKTVILTLFRANVAVSGSQYVDFYRAISLWFCLNYT